MGMSTEEHAAHTGLNQSKTEKLAEVDAMKKQLWVAIPIAIVAALMMTWEILVQYDVVPMMSLTMLEFFHHLLPILATYTLFIVGKPYLLGFYRFLRYGKANMDTLIGIGTSMAYLYSFVVTAFEDTLKPFINVEQTYYDVTIIVIAFIALGKYLEARSKIKTGDAIEKLLNLQVKTAVVIKNGQEKELPIDQILHGDEIIIKPGSNIPVDGIITEGESYVDESMVTGESMPVDKIKGGSVIGATINQDGILYVKAVKVGKDTFLSHIIKLVETAQGTKIPIQKFADKITNIFVPSVLAVSILTFAFWWYLSNDLSRAIAVSVSVLVIACPCALGLATPTALMVGSGMGAKRGILIRKGEAIQTIKEIKTIIFDKTGTITKGKPEVKAVYSNGKKEYLMDIAASMEKLSEHPVARAIVEKANLKRYRKVTGFKILRGRGVEGKIGKNLVVIGNSTLMYENGISVKEFENHIVDFEGKGLTTMIVSENKKAIGIIGVADAVKEDSVSAINKLNLNGFRTIMITGDNPETARAIGKEGGL